MTPKQELFSLAVASGMNASEAYRQSYRVGHCTKVTTVNRQAFDLMQNSRVIARIAELRKPIVAKVGFTLEKHLQDLATLRNAAAQRGKFAAAVAAEATRGRHSGVVNRRSKVLVPSCPPPHQDDKYDYEKLSKDELKTLLALLKKAGER